MQQPRQPIEIDNVPGLYVLDVVKAGGAPDPWKFPPDGGITSYGQSEGTNVHMIQWHHGGALCQVNAIVGALAER